MKKELHNEAVIDINCISEPLLKKMNILNKADRIFNMDECGVGAETATKRKAYGIRGEHSYHQKVRFR